MRMVLINPGGSSPFAPPLALPTIAGHMKRRGHDVRQLDLAAELAHHLLAPERVELACERAAALRRRLARGRPMASLRAAVLRRRRSQATRDRLAHAQARVEQLLARSGRTLATLERAWTPAGFRGLSEDYPGALTAVNDALAIASLSMPRWSLGMAKGALELSNDMIAEDPFAPYYAQVVAPRLRAIGPELVGFSVTYLSQVPFAITAMHRLRSAGVDCPFVVGGSAFTILCDQHELATSSGGSPSSETIASLVRSMLQPYGIRDEGELPFAALCDALAAGADVRAVPNLVSAPGGALVMNPVAEPLAGDELPDPAFDDLPIGTRYLAPAPLVPLATSRGCYWKRCAFCDETAGRHLKDRWREVAPDRILRTVEQLRRELDVRFVNFCDKAMSPRMMQALAAGLPARAPGLRWGTMARFDAALERRLPLAAAAGCSYLGVGLESGCQRVLDKMRKGYDVETLQRLIDACARLGIKLHLSVMFGFPTETPDEARQTFRFVEANSQKIFSILSNPWWPQVGSEVMRRPAEFAVAFDDDRRVGNCCSSYAVAEGMTHEEAMEMHAQFMREPFVRDRLILSQREFLPDDHVYLAALCGDVRGAA